jgi:hypothetical protein
VGAARARAAAQGRPRGDSGGGAAAAGDALPAASLRVELCESGGTLAVCRVRCVLPAAGAGRAGV